MLKDRTQWPQIPLRFGIGGIILYNAAPWLFSRSGHESYVAALTAVGLPFPELSAWLVAGLEVLTSILLIIGLWVPGVALVLVIELATRVLFIVIRKTGFPPPLPNFETNMLYLGGLIALVIAGAGRWSIDWMRRTRAVITSIS